MSQGTAQIQGEVLTGEHLLAMGDIGPCELVDGKVVPMTPTGGEHARIEAALGLELALFVRQRQVGWVLGGEVGIFTRRDPDRVRGADLAFISRQRAPDGPPKGFLEVGPELVVEIISPGDRWQEVQQKLAEYFALGVEQVWVVEPENRALLVYYSPAEIRRFTEEDKLIGDGVLEGFSFPVSTLFDR
jgi:Uma2 family endonuclease